MDFEDAFPIIQQVIDGLEATHQKNIIHRDPEASPITITKVQMHPDPLAR